MEAEKVSVYYDTKCSMCAVFVSAVERSSVGHKCDMKDMWTQLPETLSQEAVDREIHAIDSQGNVYKNIDAILHVISLNPRWRFLANIGALPGIHFVLTHIYLFVAKHRHLFSRFFVLPKVH